MKRTLVVSLIVILLVGIFLVEPFIGLSRLAAAVQARDAAALGERVDFPRLRLSLSRQVIDAYLQITGRKAKLGRFGSALAVGTGVTMADPIVAQLINPKTLIVFLNSAEVSQGQLNLKGGVAPLRNGDFGSVWQAFANSEYGLGDFHISLPPSAPPGERYRLRLELLQWTWKLTAVDLPQTLRVQLARELQKRIGS